MRQKNMKIFTALLLLLSTVASYAQGTVRIPTMNGKAFIDVEKDVRGTKLISNDWLSGKILLADNKITNPVDLNVDLYKHQFVMRGNGDKKIILDDDKISGAYLPIKNQEKLFLKIEGNNFVDSKSSTNIYIVHTPKSNFIIEGKNKFIKDFGDSNGGYSKSGKEFKTESKYYVLNSDGKYQSIKKVNKKNLAKVYPNKSDIIKKADINISKVNALEDLYYLLKK